MSQRRHLGMVWFCRSILCTCSTNIRNSAQELWKKEEMEMEKGKEKEKEMGMKKKKKKKNNKKNWKEKS